MVKKVMSVTVEEDVLSKWKDYTDKNFINSSKLIEKLLEEHLKKRK
jgi:hypothetical protein